MNNQNLKKWIIPNLPYILFVYLFDKAAQAVRLAPGADLSGKLLCIGNGFTSAFASPLPSFSPVDMLIGIAGAILIRLIVYTKGKNAKKYRKGMEYGSARWGNAEDIKPYIDPMFENNVLLTQTERLMMSSRPKHPKYARNKNVLVIGGSGSGKTTLCNLIARFWDVQEGTVRIGGKNVRDYTADSVLEYISMVFQNVYLFHDSVENNIRFGRPEATHEQVVAAAKRACCHDFILSLPEGYDTIIGEGGSTLSGGEKQRISIARAILKDAPIIILDEATSSVDPENEQALLSAIQELTKDKTLISIAHRLSTVRNADQIIVIDQGRIVQRGTHHELLQKEGIYQRFLTLRTAATGWQL